MYIVEAVGSRGVSINSWSSLRDHIGTGRFYEKMIHRHINFSRENKMVDNLETFLNEAIGLKYGLSALKLSKQKTQLIKDND